MAGLIGHAIAIAALHSTVVGLRRVCRRRRGSGRSCGVAFLGG